MDGTIPLLQSRLRNSLVPAVVKRLGFSDTFRLASRLPVGVIDPRNRRYFEPVKLGLRQQRNTKRLSASGWPSLVPLILRTRPKGRPCDVLR